MSATGTQGPLGAEDWQAIARRSQRAIAAFLARRDGDGEHFEAAMRLAALALRAQAELLANPAALARAQADLWAKHMELWQATARRLAGGEAEPVATPDDGDRRFRDAAWSEDAIFDHIKQSYLISAAWLQETMAGAAGLGDDDRRKLAFYTRQYVDALSPTNFAATNPEVLRAAAASRGESLVRGLGNLLDDLERGGGVRMVKRDAFRLGRDVATAPGKVVFQNELMQLLQLAPETERVHRRPLLVIPPWINKYYILDLRPQNSFLRWLVGQGHTVFVVSWVNPDAALAHKSFEDYMLEGPLAALDAIQKATGEKRVTALGYCIGGTLLACTLAHMAARRDRRIAAATFLTTLVDFEEVGEIRVFIDEEQVAGLERAMAKQGYFEGAKMAGAFSTLRANDLIWSFVIDNYLLGKQPPPFDILYWNSDSTRLPAAMHSEYLRRLYLDNALASPGALTLGGTPLHLERIRIPAYILAAREDHIAPWVSAYKATGLMGGPTVFTLAKSGHVAGVVNPPAKNRYGFWTGDTTPAAAEAWLAGAEERQGSWWPHWQAWLAAHSGAKVTARQPGAGGLDALEDAPGSYVRVDLRDG